ncbi:FMN-binding protein [Curtobacterium sp. SL109]|uniref:FMN-binding protein n=1 Tax=Curtobacterium sp. SL109 TaxID=2994662 RepID=UPI002272E215|nr:FMN-binding protein [Curtobacterium sp. SL109]MCY1693116.1 FMN-binding protein [Curtobacterium sp. SL109]
MRARIVIGGVLVSIGILSAGVESAVVHRDAVSAADGTGTSDAGPSGTPSTGTGTGSSSTSGALQDGTYIGTAAATQFGNVQVQVTVAGGKISDVTPLQLTDRDGRSVQISAQAAPVLRQEALSAQSAEIDTVSGATYTSEGYLQSLQSALDQAR